MTTVNSFLSWEKKNFVCLFFFVKHISIFFNKVLLCVFFVIFPERYQFMKTFIHMYIHQRIDLRFLLLQCMFISSAYCMFFTDIFTSHHFNHDPSPQPTSPSHKNILSKMSCLHILGGANLPCLQQLMLPVPQNICSSIYTIKHEQGIMNKKFCYIYCLNGNQQILH